MFFHTNVQSSKSHQVTQFHIQNWSPQVRSSNPSTIVTVMEEVYKVQRKTENRPIVVHCRSAITPVQMILAAPSSCSPPPVTLSAGRGCSVP